jgi:hypothetical protein
VVVRVLVHLPDRVVLVHEFFTGRNEL